MKHVVQVGDYGCLLKMDDGEAVLRGQVHLLRVFMLIGGRSSSEYIKALTASVLLWVHWKKINHPCWLLFLRNANAFNEESGEISFSALARDLARGGIRGDVGSCNKTYRLIKTTTELADDINIELGCDDFGGSKSRTVKRDAVEVSSTLEFFRGVIRHILANRYRHYGKECGVLTKQQTGEARPTVAFVAVPTIMQRVGHLLPGQVSGLWTDLRQYWVAEHRDLWPEGVPMVQEDSSDENVEEGDHTPLNLNCLSKPVAKRVEVTSLSRKRKVTNIQKKSSRQRKGDPTDFSEIDERLNGRIVALPAWTMGEKWAKENYERPSKARLHARLSGYDRYSENGEDFSCTLLSDDKYVLYLEKQQVAKYLIAVEDEDQVMDTPQISLEEDSE